jgi:hypothetical protein
MGHLSVEISRPPGSVLSGNQHYGAIVSVYTGTEEAITALTGDGIAELRDMLADARRSPKDWHNFLEDFVSDPDIIARVKEKNPR